MPSSVVECYQHFIDLLVAFYQTKQHHIPEHYGVNITMGCWQHQWRTQEFFSGGVQQIQLRTEDREDGDLGAVAP